MPQHYGTSKEKGGGKRNKLRAVEQSRRLIGMRGYLAVTPGFPVTGIGITGPQQKSTACQCPWLNKAANQRHDSLSCRVMSSLTDVNMYRFPQKTSAPSLLPVIVSVRHPAHCSMDGADGRGCLPGTGSTPLTHQRERGRWSGGAQDCCSRGQVARERAKDWNLEGGQKWCKWTWR